MKDSPERQYTREWLQVHRPQPMFDKRIMRLYKKFYGITPKPHTDLQTKEFKEEFVRWIKSFSMNSYKGLDTFERTDMIQGCTQFIDNLYQMHGINNVMTVKGDYRYHWRLNNDIHYYTIDDLDSSKVLLMSAPFPATGDLHSEMQDYLDKCLELGIPVHLDGAWASCCRNIDIDLSHPAIQSFAVSLSKGGMGGNRVGLRWHKEPVYDSITISNDFSMNQQALMHLGTVFMRELGPEYLWRTYEKEYEKVCRDFGLTPTNAIHIALDENGDDVGVRPLIRCLKDE